MEILLKDFKYSFKITPPKLSPTSRRLKTTGHLVVDVASSVGVYDTHTDARRALIMTLIDGLEKITKEGIKETEKTELPVLTVSEDPEPEEEQSDEEERL